jgi:uncharacterized protein (DUF885 family)
MSEDTFARGEGESLEVYIARLRAIDRSRLSEDEQLALVLSLRVAEKNLQRSRLGTAAPQLSTLEHCKQAIRKLPRKDREHLGRWLASGMPG